MRKPRKPSPEPPIGTIFDDVYWTMLQKLTILIVPAINEVFGTAYDKT